MKTKKNVVWLKRDLRLHDHNPFFEAEKAEIDYVAIYIFEPSMCSYPDCSDRHLQFVYHSLLKMNAWLKDKGRQVTLFYAEAEEVFEFLCDEYDLENVYSYQESGIRLTWERDKRIAKLLCSRQVRWKEFQRDGILRGIQNRQHWDKSWYASAYGPIVHNQYANTEDVTLNHPFSLPDSFKKKVALYPDSFQKPGEEYAWKYLRSFCDDRGKNYAFHISKPTESRKSCGRLSPYLAWGNLSIRQVYQYVNAHENYTKYKRGFNGLLTRLKWHCHFIQKFEMECDYEKRCVNRGYESLSYANDLKLIDAWKNGTTGFPLVDACMRCLKATGWLNFRMRAMLVSVFCHHFDCDWRKGVYHLAQLFLDYEPGIHFTQFQMQAGTTGVNTIRMYNPVKQSLEHDPEGVFIKKWVSELRDMPQQFIHEPWKLSVLERELKGLSISYPSPVVDITERGKVARAKIWGHRKNAEVKQESRRIVATHTRNTRRPKGKSNKENEKK